MQIDEKNKPVREEPISVSSGSQLPDINEAVDEDAAETIVSEDELTSMSKAQLAVKLEEVLAIEDIASEADIVNLIKSAYDKLVKEEYAHKLKIFTQDGSPEEDFTPRIDPLDEKVERLYKEFNKKKADLRRQKEKTLQDNLSTKKLIIDELRELLKSEDHFSKAYNKFQALQSKWRATGNVPRQNMHTLQENHHFLTGKFYEIVKISNELRELDRKKNLEIKNELCEKADRLVEEPSLKKALDSLRFLQEEWRASNNLSKELSDPLWQRFKTATDKIYQRRKEYVAQIKQRQQANLAAKIALCEQLDKLAETDLSSYKLCRAASEKAETIWAEWQKIGFVPKSDNGECWKRFKKARQHFHNVIDTFYAKQRREFGQNLQKKIDICVRAESLQESTDWAATAEILKKLQVEWQAIGPVAVKDSQPIWNRFRKACDHFFENKNKEIKEKENALLANVRIKQAMVTKVDELQASGDMNQNLEELKKIQEEWAASGPVPVRENDKLNNAFGKAVENFLEKIKGNTPGQEKIFYRLKYEQMLKYPHGQEQIKRERFNLQDKIKKLEAEANQLETNLGFFGKSKKANPILDEYTKKLEEVKQELGKLREQIKLIPSV